MQGLWSGLHSVSLAPCLPSATNRHRCSLVLQDGLELVDGLCENKLGTIERPAPSCRALLGVQPPLASGVYYVENGAQAIRAYCELDPAVLDMGAGWELVQRQIGGYTRAEHTNLASFRDMRNNGANMMEPLMPVEASNMDSQRSGVSPRYEFRNVSAYPPSWFTLKRLDLRTM